MGKSIWTAFVFALGLAGIGFAAPEGFELVEGQASPPTSDGQGGLVVHCGEKTILQWQEFSIPEGMKFSFAQASNRAAVLNRVMSFKESRIMGELLSNGAVYLIDPNGVLIDPGGRINMSRFLSRFE